MVYVYEFEPRCKCPPKRNVVYGPLPVVAPWRLCKQGCGRGFRKSHSCFYRVMNVGFVKDKTVRTLGIGHTLTRKMRPLEAVSVNYGFAIDQIWMEQRRLRGNSSRQPPPPPAQPPPPLPLPPQPPLEPSVAPPPQPAKIPLAKRPSQTQVPSSNSPPVTPPPHCPAPQAPAETAPEQVPAAQEPAAPCETAIHPGVAG